MSPIRFVRALSSPNSAAMPPSDMNSSSTPVSARMNACRNPIAPPSSRTIRAPTISRPSDLPCVISSTAVGSTTMQNTREAIVTALMAASSSVPARAGELTSEHPGDPDSEVDDDIHQRAGAAQHEAGGSQVEADGLAGHQLALVGHRRACHV